MSGLDKIIEHIETSATETANKMVENAKAEAERILAAGKEAAKAKEASINKQSELDVAATNKRIRSAAELTEKRMILQAKQAEIDNILAAAETDLLELDDNEYFDVILRMVPKYALAREGIISFSKTDIDRMPAGFEQKINAALSGDAKLTVSDKPAKINGGFILGYGDVEENCSFNALIEASREELQDKISQIMFN